MFDLVVLKKNRTFARNFVRTAVVSTQKNECIWKYLLL